MIYTVEYSVNEINFEHFVRLICYCAEKSKCGIFLALQCIFINIMCLRGSGTTEHDKHQKKLQKYRLRNDARTRA